MKNQYFGDINDYRKYGLLRCLQEVTKLSLGVCWMLTDIDPRGDGRFLGYLRYPARYRQFDNQLYTLLRNLHNEGLLESEKRNVELSERRNILHPNPKPIYFGKPLRDDCSQRKQYFEAAWKELEQVPLLFFDPDKGIEIEGIRRGSECSSQYIYLEEINEAIRRQHSIVIYQHFRQRSSHDQRNDLIKRRSMELSQLMPSCQVKAFRAKNVVYLLVIYPEHASRFQGLHELIAQRWHGQIEYVP